MLLIYSSYITNRTGYTLGVIFEDIIKTKWKLASDITEFTNYSGPKINYSNQKFEDSLNIEPAGLLEAKGISLQHINIFITDGFKAFFENKISDYPFDIFSATFYLISRYEEYLPHTKDCYGRFPHTLSLAYREEFLDLPLINIWLQHFRKFLLSKFQNLIFGEEKFSYSPTYDIDIAWSFKNKGPVRNLGGFLKNPSIKRLRVLSGLDIDPFDSYSFIKGLHLKNNLIPKYFILTARKNSVYDKNILPKNEDFKVLIKDLDGEICLHPSWGSSENIEEIKIEKKLLEEITGKKINKSRQHYIKLNFPNTYSDLIKTGITDEFSMGYGSINGFRASIASSYNWYNLIKEEKTELRLHPFCFMDANSFFEQKQNAENTFLELHHYLMQCKNINGKFITIFHNHFLGSDPLFKGWKEMYARFIKEITFNSND